MDSKVEFQSKSGEIVDGTYMICLIWVKLKGKVK